jgi:hypothetical protein
MMQKLPNYCEVGIFHLFQKVAADSRFREDEGSIVKVCLCQLHSKGFIDLKLCRTSVRTIDTLIASVAAMKDDDCYASHVEELWW